jgi:hypothetical protein
MGLGRARKGEDMSQMLDCGPFDPQRVDEFLHDYNRFSLLGALGESAEELDGLIRQAGLSLADKIESLQRLAPKADATGPGEELRMERLLLSVEPQDLPLFKAALEYDGDYKDMVEYVFHDIDNKARQNRIIEHFRTVQRQVGVKVLTDVDDTMYANLIDERYPKKTLYPGVLEFYAALKQEPFELRGIPVTTLSARPNPIAGKLEEASLRKLVEFTGERLCPSGLSGALVSSVVGSAETVLRAGLDLLSDKIPHGQEDEIGEVKFRNFMHFARVYPEYRYVFVGDSGQADALTAQLMVAEPATAETSRVVSTFIHNLQQSGDDQKSVSASFKRLDPGVIIGKEGSPAGRRGVIVFRNYIEAALIARTHRAALDNLITAEELAEITKEALKQFRAIPFGEREASGKRLREQYRQDAEAAYRLMTQAPPATSTLLQALTEIRSTLDDEFWQGVAPSR